MRIFATRLWFLLAVVYEFGVCVFCLSASFEEAQKLSEQNAKLTLKYRVRTTA